MADWVSRHRLLLAAGATGLVVAAIAWFSIDHSRVLTPREVQSLKLWAVATQSPEVVVLFEQLKGDGELTVHESERLAEVAKAAPIPQGLYEPVALD